MSTHVPGFHSFFRVFASFCINQQHRGYAEPEHLWVSSSFLSHCQLTDCSLASVDRCCVGAPGSPNGVAGNCGHDIIASG